MRVGSDRRARWCVWCGGTTVCLAHRMGTWLASHRCQKAARLPRKDTFRDKTFERRRKLGRLLLVQCTLWWRELGSATQRHRRRSQAQRPAAISTHHRWHQVALISWRESIRGRVICYTKRKPDALGWWRQPSVPPPSWTGGLPPHAVDDDEKGPR